jgi:hypothetical protein
MRRLKNTFINASLVALVSIPLSVGILSFAFGLLTSPASAPAGEFTLRTFATLVSALARIIP